MAATRGLLDYRAGVIATKGIRLAGRPRTFNSATLREYLDDALHRAGRSTRLIPHDFRRLAELFPQQNRNPVMTATMNAPETTDTVTEVAETASPCTAVLALASRPSVHSSTAPPRC
ncbi:hypothetical protein ABZ511_24735 [Nocardia gamkensis]|uniref:hypothetical protein n=1 Tax=Nocardia gamkensis TaxID=352869 RepID=UPI0033D7C1DD